MRHIASSFLGVLICYSLALYSPAAEAKASTFSVKNYVNGRHKKTLKDLLLRSEKQLPSDFFEMSLKEMSKNKSLGKAWFSRAKMGDDYVYARLGKVKFLAKVVQQGRNEVIMVNGVRITARDMSDFKRFKSKIGFVYFKEILKKKGLFSYLLDLKSSFAANREAVDPDAGGTIEEDVPAVVDPVGDKQSNCYLRLEAAVQTNTQNLSAQEDKARMDQVRADCEGVVPVPADATIQDMKDAYNQSTGGQTDKKKDDGLAIFLFAAIGMLILFMALKGKNKDKKKKDDDKDKETPEDDKGVGRGDDNPVICGGESAKCGDDHSGDEYTPTYGSGSSNPGTSEDSGDTGVYTEPDGSVNTENSGGVGRDLDAVPGKTKARVKTR